MKIISVKLIPKASENSIEELDSYVKVRTTEVPEKGKANNSLIKQLAKHYHVAQSKIKIVQGTRLRKKLVEIDL
jgi:hypothetical protein